MTARYPAPKARRPRPRRPWCLPSLRRLCSCTSPWTIRLTSKSMASRTIIGSSVMLWVLTRLGIRGRQRGKIHCRGPHPLERGSITMIGQRCHLLCQMAATQFTQAAAAPMSSPLSAWPGVNARGEPAKDPAESARIVSQSIGAAASPVTKGLQRAPVSQHVGVA